jgi:preprotein translocase subunit YajC
MAFPQPKGYQAADSVRLTAVFVAFVLTATIVRPLKREAEFRRPQLRSLSMFITPAFAQAATDTAASPFGSGFEMIILFVPLMVVWYFLLIRPQRAQAKKRADTLSAIRRGDQVVTAGGLVGKVTKVVDDKEVEVEIADGVRVRVVRSGIADVRVKGEPVKADAA